MTVTGLNFLGILYHNLRSTKGILDVDPVADDEVVKKQYKKLALLLHPDKKQA